MLWACVSLKIVTAPCYFRYKLLNHPLILHALKKVSLDIIDLESLIPEEDFKIVYIIHFIFSVNSLNMIATVKVVDVLHVISCYFPLP